MCTMGTFGQSTGGGIAAGIVAFLKIIDKTAGTLMKIRNVS